MSVLRSLQAADIAGIRTILVHAISETAKQFFTTFGFVPSPLEPLTMMIALAEAAKSLIDQ